MSTEPDCFQQLGLLSTRENDYGSAIKNFLEAIQYKDDFTEAYIERARAYAIVGKKDEAKKDLDKIQMTTKDPALLNQAAKQLEALNTVAASSR